MSYQSKTAKILIDIKAINFNFKSPYILTSGRKSPVYVDCRKIISFTKERSQIISFIQKYIIKHNIKFDLLAGGETAGIPYASFLAERLKKPMIYIRKQPKKFGKGSQIEGSFKKNQRSILIEDLATDGKSKMTFVNVMRKNNLKVNETFVIFYYDIFKKSEQELKKSKIKIHYLCTWKDILNEIKKQKIIAKKNIESVERFLSNPIKWDENE